MHANQQHKKLQKIKYKQKYSLLETMLMHKNTFFPCREGMGQANRGWYIGYKIECHNYYG